MSIDNFSDDTDIMEIIDETKEPIANNDYIDDSSEDTAESRFNDTLNLVTKYLQYSDIPIFQDKKERDSQIILWLNEYHSLDETASERRQYLRDCVLLNTFFLLPWILSSKHLPLPLFEDTLQTIVINLMRAIENYTPNSNTKFSSYISGYIKDGIKIAIHKEQIITVPIHRKHRKKVKGSKVELNDEKPDDLESLIKDSTKISNESSENINEGDVSINASNTINTKDTSSSHTVTASGKYLLPEVTMFDDALTIDDSNGYTCNPEYLLLQREEKNKYKNKLVVMPYLNNSYALKYKDLYDESNIDNTASHYQRLVATLQFLLSEQCSLLSNYERDVILYHYGLFNNPKYTLDDIVTLLATKYSYNVSKPRISQINKCGVAKLKKYFNSLGIDIPKLF